MEQKQETVSLMDIVQRINMLRGDQSKLRIKASAYFTKWKALKEELKNLDKDLFEQIDELSNFKEAT